MRGVKELEKHRLGEIALRQYEAKELSAQEVTAIPCAEFVQQFFSARDTVRQLKKSFGADLRVDVIVKDNDGQASEIGIDLDCDGIDALVNHTYDPVELEHFLTEAKS